ncbi:MAG: ROK family protein [Eubacteriales bacterium]|nr:ROK family protein [Eubacteriales bacterium]
MLGNNNRLVKERNEALVMEVIRKNREISKADIAKITKLSANAIGMITSALIEKEFIYKSSTGKSSGGRRPEMLSIKPGAFFSLGVDIDTDRIRFATVDLAGEVLEIKRLKMDCVGNVEKVFEAIKSEMARHSCKYFLGAGIAVAGQVDIKSKTIVLAPNLRWSDVNVSKFFGGNIFIENEAISSAIYESFYGMCKDTDNFICINSKSGIGAGIFIDGKVYRGKSGSAGEIGHLITDYNGQKCECGSFGCLETVAASSRIAARCNLPSILDVVERAKEGDRKINSVLKDVSKHMGVALVSLVNTLNPEKIILGKEFCIYGQLLLGDIASFVKSYALPLSRNVEILISDAQNSTSVLGAALLPQLKIFKGWEV